MADWGYKAADSRVGKSPTIGILDKHSFLWRPLFLNAPSGKRGLPRINHYLGDIDPEADRIYVFFAAGHQPDFAGAFTFRGSVRFACAHPDGLAPAVVIVPDDDPVALDLRASGYPPDPFLGRYTGFDLARIARPAAPNGRFRWTGEYALVPAR